MIKPDQESSHLRFLVVADCSPCKTLAPESAAQGSGNAQILAANSFLGAVNCACRFLEWDGISMICLNHENLWPLTVLVV